MDFHCHIDGDGNVELALLASSGILLVYLVSAPISGRPLQFIRRHCFTLPRPARSLSSLRDKWGRVILLAGLSEGYVTVSHKGEMEHTLSEEGPVAAVLGDLKEGGRRSVVSADSGSLLAIALLNGKVRFQERARIRWEFQLSDPVVAICAAPLVADGGDAVVACCYSGATFVMLQSQVCIRLDPRVDITCFDVGLFTMPGRSTPEPCALYGTLDHRVMLYALRLPASVLVPQRTQIHAPTVVTTPLLGDSDGRPPLPPTVVR
eukprot:TRINITY_DN8154_c0_g1_i3.p1 TRINITY_DN8154_c0_g1~~TRINITY_DN8154_c0_g1_i3.p1  ORF type:complete len:263 (-),score=40.39 TRINITY_DN8154_c0_g1_i3:93-881(-)